MLATVAVRASEGKSSMPLSAGAAKLEITPDVRLSNWVTHKPYGEALDPVFARALVLGLSDERVAILTWDLLYPLEGVVAKVRKEAAKATGIKEGNILVTATHNHSAPWSPVIGDPLTAAEQKVLNSFLTDTNYPGWAEMVVSKSVEALRLADAARRPSTLGISRAYVGDVMFNRRPIKPDGTVQTLGGVTNVFVMGNGLRYGKVDPVLTLLMFKDESGKTIASVYHMACHAVVVYPRYDGVSGDWPGMVSSILERDLGGEAIFLQGCAGDINPIRRGLEARDHIAKTVASRAIDAAKVSHPMELPDAFYTASEVVKAPVYEVWRKELGLDHKPCEVQVLSVGNLALVGLPGEPFSGLSSAIVEQSGIPHTLVLGYSNGLGVQYVGLPGDRAKGGYEVGVRCLGDDTCGQLLVDAAVRLLPGSRSPRRR
jgi:hypothetical protein